jgi:hypothetical protein
VDGFEHASIVMMEVNNVTDDVSGVPTAAVSRQHALMHGLVALLAQLLTRMGSPSIHSEDTTCSSLAQTPSSLHIDVSLLYTHVHECASHRMHS